MHHHFIQARSHWLDVGVLQPNCVYRTNVHVSKLTCIMPSCIVLASIQGHLRQDDIRLGSSCRYLSFNCPGRLSGTGNTAAATASSIPLMSVTFTVLSPLAGGPTYSQVLFAGAHPSYSNANNLVLTSDASAGINIAKQVVAQVTIITCGSIGRFCCSMVHAGCKQSAAWLGCLASVSTLNPCLA